MFEITETIEVKGSGHTGSVRATLLDENYESIRLQPVFIYQKVISVEVLVAGLKEAFKDFPLVCGSIQDSNVTNDPARRDYSAILNLGGGSVKLAVQRSSLTLEDVLTEARVQRYIDSLARPVHATSTAQLQPIMQLTLTVLSGGGSVLGVEASHLVMDGRSFYDFFQRVSSAIAKGQPNVPDLDRSEFGDYIYKVRESSVRDEKPVRKLTPQERRLRVKVALGYLLTTKLRVPLFVTKTFEIEKRFINKRKESHEVSTQDVLTAYIVQLVSESVLYKDDKNIVFTYLQDIRSVEGLNLSSSYFGNGVIGRQLTLTVGDIQKSSIIEIAKKMRQNILALSKEVVNRTLAGHLKLKKDKFALIDFFGRGVNITISNWSRFPVKSLDFGQGLPIAYETAHDKAALIRTIKILPDVCSPEAWRFRVCLPRAEMGRFSKLHANRLSAQ